MSEEETFIQWLQKASRAFKETLKDSGDRRMLRGLAEVFIAVLFMGFSIPLVLYIHWLLIFPMIAIGILIIAHGFYLWEHPI